MATAANTPACALMELKGIQEGIYIKLTDGEFKGVLSSHVKKHR